MKTEKTIEELKKQIKELERALANASLQISVSTGEATKLKEQLQDARLS